MRTIARGLVALFIIMALGASVETRPPVAQASCCATPTLASGSGSTLYTRHNYSVSGSVYAALQCTCGGSTTFDWMPVGQNMSTVVVWSGLSGGQYYHIWTCQQTPHDCSASLTVGPSSCGGCASASPDGQIWWDHHTIHTPRLSGSQWFGQPVSTGAGLQPRKGIGGGGSPCQCPTFYYQFFINGVPYCKTALPPFNQFPC